jgi:hypothetical protein
MKVKARIVFCDFRRVQGWRYGVTKFLTRSEHTHAHIEIDFKMPFAFIVADFNSIRTIRLSHLEKLGIKSYYTFELGEIDITDTDIWYAQKYPKANSTVAIFYQAIGRFFGMRRPVSCVTFICDYLRYKGWNTPDLFTPRELWESLHASNDDQWSSPRWKDNAGKMVE